MAQGHDQCQLPTLLGVFLSPSLNPPDPAASGERGSALAAAKTFILNARGNALGAGLLGKRFALSLGLL